MIQHHNFKTAVEPCICPNCGSNLGQSHAFKYGNIALNQLGNLEFEGCEVLLPKSQYLIVEALVKARGRGLTRSFLATIIGGEIYDQTVSKYIERLRSSFRQIEPSFDQISSLRGFGAYRWDYRERGSSGTPPKQHEYSASIATTLAAIRN